MTDPSVPEVIEMVDLVLKTYSLTPASDPSYPTLMRFRKPSEVSKSKRLQAETVSRTGHWRISHSERNHSWY
jgi:hypothetical protein